MNIRIYIQLILKSQQNIKKEITIFLFCYNLYEGIPWYFTIHISTGVESNVCFIIPQDQNVT